jgi:Complex I intermediate-associated protein 30 (CIA30)
VWKMTTRTKPDRGELLYQAPFDFTSTSSDAWTTVKVPFPSFRYVRGPRMIPDGPPLNTTAGLYQIGMTMSKFAFAEKMTEIGNFRDGFFELQLQEIGLYKEQQQRQQEDSSTSMLEAVTTPKVYSRLEAKSKRPLIVKVLLPVAKIFFSEQR